MSFMLTLNAEPRWIVVKLYFFQQKIDCCFTSLHCANIDYDLLYYLFSHSLLQMEAELVLFLSQSSCEFWKELIKEPDDSEL